MHLVFIPYGEENAVNFLLRQMECQKFKLPFTNPDKVKGVPEKGHIWVAGNIRRLPGGFIDYVFPAENLDVILKSLDLDKPYHYQDMKWAIEPTLWATRKALRLKPLPKKFKTNQHLIWFKDHVNVIPIGIRHDIMDWKDPNGTIHEAL